jgi:DivIVA protein
MESPPDGERFPRPSLRYRRFRGGYRKEDVEFALAELRLTLRQLEHELESLRGRARELEDDLRQARRDLDRYRTKDSELSQTLASALRRASEIEDSAHERARAIVAAAEDAAARARADANRRLEETGGELNELLRLRESLVRSMRGVVGEFHDALARVERGDRLYAVPLEPPAGPPPPPPPETPPAPPPAAAEASPAEPAAHEDPLFETRVELDAGPFADFASLSTFERALARMPGVDDVYVRRLADDRALIELTLRESAPLLVTMREHLPYELQVRDLSPTSLVLDVFAHSAAAR